MRLRFLLVSLILWGCRSNPEQPSPEAPKPEAPTPEAQKPSAEEAPGRPRPKAELVLAKLPHGGSLEALVQAELARAATDSRRLVVYVGATWCEPCRRFHDALAAGALDAAFPNIRFLEFDADRHSQMIVAAGCQSDYLPMFTVPEPTGRCPKDRLEGAVKGERALGYIVPRLKALLEGKPYPGETPR